MKYSALILAVAFLFGCSDGRIKPLKEDIRVIRSILDRSIEEQKLTLKMTEDSEKHVVESKKIFEMFWDPLALKKYGDLQWGYDLYTKAEYLIAQTEITVAIQREDAWHTNLTYAVWGPDRREFRRPTDEKWVVHRITNFISNVDVEGCEILYLTPEAKEEMKVFLGKDFTEFGTPNVMTPAQAQNKSAQRLAAANTLTTIIPGHWGEGWHLISHPEIKHIFFNKDLSQAIVAFRIGYEGGYAGLKKDNGQWIIQESFMDWVE